MKLRGTAYVVLVALVFAFAVLAGLRGIDFGWHWDETRLLGSVAESIEAATLLPNRYNYPSISYELALAGALPDAAAALGDARRVMDSGLEKEAKKAKLAGVAAQLARGVDRPEFKLRVRAIFLVVSLLTIAWVFLASLAWRGDPLEALLAAALLATSWEVGYHARWIAPDALLMQFAALALVPLFLARRAGTHPWRWLVTAAVAVGLAMGTKYQGVVLLAPVLVLAFERSRAEGRRAAAAVGTRLLPLALLSGLVYLLTTPGMLLQPMRFAYDLLFELHHYRTGHGSETVAPGGDHLLRVLEYLSLAAFSRYWPLALLVFATAVAGAAVVLRRDRGAAVVLLLAPALALLSMGSLRVMIARNLLFLLPALALLAARGVRAAANALPGRLAPALPGIAAAVVVAVNAHWLWTAADSIAGRSRIDHGAAIARYLDAHPHETFCLSYGPYVALPANERVRANVTTDPARATRYLLLTPDVRAPFGNRAGIYEQVSGSYEVNYEWYPDWQGDSRVMAMDARYASRMNILPAPNPAGPPP